MNVNELIEALIEHRRVMGGWTAVGSFADEFGTWHPVTGIKFRPHDPSLSDDSYNPPVGGSVMFEYGDSPADSGDA